MNYWYTCIQFIIELHNYEKNKTQLFSVNKSAGFIMYALYFVQKTTIHSCVRRPQGLTDGSVLIYRDTCTTPESAFIKILYHTINNIHPPILAHPEL